MKVSGLLLFVGAISAELGTDATGSADISACGEPEPEQPLFVGLYFLTDSYFLSCSPHARAGILDDYLSAFVGGMEMRFRDVHSPAIRIVYLGHRPLQKDEEEAVIGKEGISRNAVRGVDALSNIMDIAVTENYFGSNKMLFVITGLNVTEEKTERVVNKDTDPTPGGSQSGKKNSGSSDDYDTYDDDEASSNIQARSSSPKEKYRNVGGLTQYGTICSGGRAIVQDDGMSFSGVGTAAMQVATALGPVYKGAIRIRQCEEDDIGNPYFHGSECNKMRELANKNDNDEFECLNETLQGVEGKVKSPSEFFRKHSGWTPCGTSYLGSEECTKAETPYRHRNCSIMCCPKGNGVDINQRFLTISAPDGEDCGNNKICVGGKCVDSAASGVNPVER